MKEIFSMARYLQENKPPDILLIVCPMWGVDMPPLGISYLSSYLKQNGFYPDLLDINIDMFNGLSEEHKYLWQMHNYRLWNDRNLFETGILAIFDNKINSYVNQILSKNTKIIGFSVNAGNLLFSIELARRIKDKDKDKIIIFGGPHSKWFKNDIKCLEEYKGIYRGFYPGLVDIFVIGEGEIPLGEILYCFKGNKEVDKIQSIIAYRNNEYFCQGEENPIKNLDELPFPGLDWADLNRYSDKKIPILMSRGCIRRCAFCNDTYVSARYRCRSADNVFKEIMLRLERNIINGFGFCDLMLNSNVKELEKLCDLIIKEKIQITWTGQGAIKKDTNAGLLIKMRKAGCVGLTYGVESFSNKVLELMNKPYTFEDIHRVLKDTAEAKIQAYINIVTGFPGEGEEEFNETVERIKKCRKYIHGISSLASCCITLGSDLQRNSDRYQIIYPDKDGYYTWHNRSGVNNYQLRKNRAKIIFSIASELSLPIGTINLYDEMQNNMTDKPRETTDPRITNKNADNNHDLCHKERIKGKVSLPPAEEKIIICASKFIHGNLNASNHKFGEGIVIDGGKTFGFAEYRINVHSAGEYELWSYYASNEYRPAQLYIDNALIAQDGLNSLTYGWSGDDLRWFKEGVFNISEGTHILKIFTKKLIPHIHSFFLLKNVKATQDDISHFENI